MLFAIIYLIDTFISTDLKIHSELGFVAPIVNKFLIKFPVIHKQITIKVK